MWILINCVRDERGPAAHSQYTATQISLDPIWSLLQLHRKLSHDTQFQPGPMPAGMERERIKPQALSEEKYVDQDELIISVSSVRLHIWKFSSQRWPLRSSSCAVRSADEQETGEAPIFTPSSASSGALQNCTRVDS